MVSEKAVLVASAAAPVVVAILGGVAIAIFADVFAGSLVVLSALVIGVAVAAFALMEAP